MEYADGTLEVILLTHGHLMEDSGICRARHNALVKNIKKLSGFGTDLDSNTGPIED